mmetsp:Transcript_77142/g.136126  ORF Transcript_77142/g.136126 Transcript_77142/m.136126 type:complete len:332 (-) Transcript_77142:136-1131(-)|eukprot:CAMPEP_0197659478 /NCGR_PEP_ID=MMETSP1338-20131121/47835_1 /TAXON_ID=43686 ORGANISM="Pelagodinium beii, Strain RCC1491" /NCGR_SAMPLE_ID=MMETSP1338 /ASSEMBLY_ACC=CAM_ASM_000754 /LENGTH=331 /DNA_ID=CAMNT_0043236423 /DNA_START=42 /DNA_END=1037 /DNA_ORIENTATION=+
MDNDDALLSWLSLANLFLLVFGLAAGVDPLSVLDQFKEVRTILVGCSFQFILLPICGALTVYVFRLEAAYAVPLLLTTSSPGGSFSNWWCSLANADLPLSVAMTTVSTLMSMIVLPLNVLLYVHLLLSADGVEVPTKDLWPSLVVVTSAVLCGLLASHYCKEWRGVFNKIGSVSGALLMLTAMLPKKSSHGMPVFQVGYREVAVVSFPCVLGLVLAAGVSFLLPGISPAARTTLAIETCFQNTSIALTVAMQMPEKSQAIAIPLLYGAAEIFFISVFALLAWQMGWTYAPATDPFFQVLLGDYQPSERKTVRNVEMSSLREEGQEGLATQS